MSTTFSNVTQQQSTNESINAGLCWLSQTPFKVFLLMEKLQIYSKNSSHFFLQFQPYGFRVTPFICLNLAAPIFSLLRQCSLDLEPGLKQDWNLKLNLERQTTDRRQTDKRACFSTGIYRRNYLLLGAHWHRMSSAYCLLLNLILIIDDPVIKNSRWAEAACWCPPLAICIRDVELKSTSKIFYVQSYTTTN